MMVLLIQHYKFEMNSKKGFIPRNNSLQFKVKENHPVESWDSKDLVKRIINFVSVVTDRSEAMLVFRRKFSEKKYE